MSIEHGNARVNFQHLPDRNLLCANTTLTMCSTCTIPIPITKRACVRAAPCICRSGSHNRSNDGNGYGSADAEPSDKLAARDAVDACGQINLSFEQMVAFELTEGIPDDFLI